jgi:predicted dehydrogenase
MSDSRIDRRNFLKTATAVTTALGAATSAFSRPAPAKGRVLGANDRINIGVIGVGGRGTYDAGQMAKLAESHNVRIAMVCDVYQKRVNKNKDIHKVPGTLDYREVIANPEIDAVIVATPDHWHAPVALAAMDAGKDVYLEKPMCHTIEEAHMLVQTAKETKRIIQVGSQTTSGDQWAKAKQAIAEGMIGNMLMSQGSYHRNSLLGEWNWPIDKDAGPDKKGEDFIDWKMWLGKAPARPFNADRFFRFRKYWDYSGGIATDLFFHVVAPMNICWSEPQFPSRVVAGGGIYQFKDEREVPDTFHLIGDYPKGHSLVLSSSMANSQHIPGLIRGHAGTIVMVEHGMFEGSTPYITVKPERVRREGENGFVDPEWPKKFGHEVEFQIPTDDKKDLMKAHMGNFLDCMRSRQQPTLNVETAAHAQVLISLAVDSYRQGKTMYFDETKWKAVDHPVKA